MDDTLNFSIGVVGPVRGGHLGLQAVVRPTLFFPIPRLLQFLCYFYHLFTELETPREEEGSYVLILQPAWHSLLKKASQR